MNRRDFLKGLSLIPTAILAPKLVLAGIELTSPVGDIYAELFSVNRFLQDIPKIDIDGNALMYIQEQIPKAGYHTYDRHTSYLTRIIGQSQTNPVEEMRKLNNIGRQTLNLIVNGDRTEDIKGIPCPEFDGLLKLAGGTIHSLKNQDFDWIMAYPNTAKKYEEIIKKTGKKLYIVNCLPSHKGMIIGKFDDGSRTRGCSLLYAKDNEHYGKNIHKGLVRVQISEGIFRFKYYVSMAVWNRNDIKIVKFKD